MSAHVYIAPGCFRGVHAGALTCHLSEASLRSTCCDTAAQSAQRQGCIAKVSPATWHNPAQRRREALAATQEIVNTDAVLRETSQGGGAPFKLVEAWDQLQLQCATYINSDLPGLQAGPLAKPGKPTRCGLCAPAGVNACRTGRATGQSASCSRASSLLRHCCLCLMCCASWPHSTFPSQAAMWPAGMRLLRTCMLQSCTRSAGCTGSARLNAEGDAPLAGALCSGSRGSRAASGAT